MASQIVPSSLPQIPPADRCNQEIPQSSNPAAADAIVCGALASIITEGGPRCAECYSIYGGGVVAETPSTSPLWRLANVEASRELDARYRVACIGNGLFVRTGKRVR